MLSLAALCRRRSSLSRPMTSRLRPRRCFVMSYSMPVMPSRSTGPSKTATTCTRALLASSRAMTASYSVSRILPEGKIYTDDFLGEQVIHRGNFFVRIPYTVTGVETGHTRADRSRVAAAATVAFAICPRNGSKRSRCRSLPRTPARSISATRRARSRASFHRPTKCFSPRCSSSTAIPSKSGSA